MNPQGEEAKTFYVVLKCQSPLNYPQNQKSSKSVMSICNLITYTYVIYDLMLALILNVH